GTGRCRRRGRDLHLARRLRGPRHRALPRRLAAAGRDRPATHRRRRGRDDLRRAGLERAVRERLREGRRIRRLPLLDGDARDDRVGRDVEPDPPRRVGCAQGGPKAGALPAGDAALPDPPAEHAGGAGSGRDDLLPGAGLLPRFRQRRPARGLRRLAATRPARRRARSRSLGPNVTAETGRLAPDAVRTMFDRIAPVYDTMNRAMTAGPDPRWSNATRGAVRARRERGIDAWY